MFPPLALPAAMEDALKAAHAAPVRAYHHYGHALAVLEHCRQLHLQQPWQQPAEVQLAASGMTRSMCPGAATTRP